MVFACRLLIVLSIANKWQFLAHRNRIVKIILSRKLQHINAIDRQRTTFKDDHKIDMICAIDILYDHRRMNSIW